MRPDPVSSTRCSKLRRTLAPHNDLNVRGPEPGDLGWLVERHGVLYAREYGWDQSFERLVAASSPRSTRHDRAWIAETRGTASAPSCASTRRHHGQAPHAARRAPGPRAGPRHELVRGHPPRQTARLHNAQSVDQRRPPAARRIYEREGFTSRRGTEPRVRPRPRRADLVPYPDPMDRDQLRAPQAPLKAATRTTRARR